MDRQVNHLVRLVDDLLDVSRVTRGKIDLRLERVEISEVVARAVESTQPLMEQHRHKLVVDIPTQPICLRTDVIRLAQVIGNLLTNAAKYTDPCGQISISAREEGDWAVLTVRDNGIGIAPHVLPHVFELFMQADDSFTKSQGGLGIGLTLVKSLIEMLGGTVEVKSEGVGHGSEFRVRVPISDPTVDDANSSADIAASTASGHRLRLLVVDDNVDAANSLAMLLRLKGHQVRIAHDGPSAIEAAEAHCPDLVFLDIGMPGMDGYEVARRLREDSQLRGATLAAVTGWGQQDDRRRSAEAGFDHHLVKPVDTATIDALLNGISSGNAAH